MLRGEETIKLSNTSTLNLTSLRYKLCSASLVFLFVRFSGFNEDERSILEEIFESFKKVEFSKLELYFFSNKYNTPRMKHKNLIYLNGRSITKLDINFFFHITLKEKEIIWRTVANLKHLNWLYLHLEVENGKGSIHLSNKNIKTKNIYCKFQTKSDIHDYIFSRSLEYSSYDFGYFDVAKYEDRTISKAFYTKMVRNKGGINCLNYYSGKLKKLININFNINLNSM